MNKEDIIIRNLEDGSTEIDVPMPQDIGQTVTIIVDRGQGKEVRTEKD